MYSQFGTIKKRPELQKLENFPWYFGQISRNEAEQLLNENGENQGTFLIRDGPINTKNDVKAMEYRLSMLVWERNECKVVHCEILFDHNGNYYVEPNVNFASLTGLVEHYSNHPDIDMRLTTFCPKEKQEMEYEPLPNCWEIKQSSVQCHEKLSGNVDNPSNIWLGTMRSHPTEVVIKQQRDSTSLELKRSLTAEATALTKLQHNNIVKILGTISLSPFCIILQYAEKKDLLAYLFGYEDYEIAFSQIMKFAEQIAKALKFVSDNGYVHRNVRACNVLLNRELTCKLSGFGFVKKLDENQNYFVKNDDRPFSRLMFNWMALEGFTENRFTAKSDVWSFAVTVHELFTKGERPYAECFAPNLLKKIKSGYRMKRSLGMTSQVYQLLLACWGEVPDTRPSFDVIIDHLESYRTNRTPKNPISLPNTPTLRYSTR